MNLSVQMLREWLGDKDARGDRPIYSKGYVGEMDGESAVYVAAMGYAWPVGTWPEEILLSVEVSRAIVDLFRAENIEPSKADLTREVQARIAFAEAEAAKQAADAPIPNATAPAVTVPLAEAAAAAPVAGGQPKARKK